MDKVYIVTQGEYSDYGIVGAFDDYDKAKFVCEAIGLSEDDIEVYETNKHYKNPPKYQAVLHIDDDTVRIYPILCDSQGPCSERSKGIGGIGKREWLYVYATGRDRESATKNVSDFRAQFLEEYKHYDDLLVAAEDWLEKNPK